VRRRRRRRLIGNAMTEKYSPAGAWQDSDGGHKENILESKAVLAGSMRMWEICGGQRAYIILG